MSDPPSVTAARGQNTPRLKRSADFAAVMREGTRSIGRRVILYVRPGREGTRVGFVTGRRLGGAVARNRARRILSEAWRSVAPRLTGQYDVVLVARPDIRGASSAEVASELAESLMAAGMGSEELAR